LKGVVFAAGFGRRLHPLTATRPKHLLPIAGRPLLHRVLEALKNAGVNEIGVTIGYMADQIMEMVESVGAVPIQQKLIAGTGQALKECRPFLEGEDIFYVVYGDITVPSTKLIGLREFMERGGFDGSLLAVHGVGGGKYGVVHVRDSLFEYVAEKSSESGLVNAGAYILPAQILDTVENLPRSPRGEYELTDALNILANKGAKIGVMTDVGDWWYDVGRPVDYLRANQHYIGVELDDDVMIGSDVWLGDRVSITGPLMLSHGVRIGDGCTLVGPLVVGAGSEVAPGSHLSNSVIMERVKIVERCLLRNSILSDETEILAEVIVEDGNIPALVTSPGSKIHTRMTVSSSTII